MATTKPTVGKVSASGGKYYVSVGGKTRVDRRTLLVGTGTDGKRLEKLVGKEVRVYYATKPSNLIIAIQDTAFKIQPILCYLPPAPNVFKAIDPEVQKAALNAMVEQGFVTPEFAKDFESGNLGGV